EALDYLFGTGAHREKPPEVPALVLLDLKLPKVDGLQVLARIRGDRRLADLPVAILTSSDEERDLVEGYRLAVACYIRKPVEIQELAEAFKQLDAYQKSSHPGIT
ncbi:MAG TPA: response regulator, partial [bacterium]